MDVRTLPIQTGLGEGRSHNPSLTVPNPRAHTRLFELVPWAEVEPNAEITGHGKVVDLIEAIRAIKTGEELTYDYGITLDEPQTARLKKIWACRCGAKTCNGTMPKPRR